MPLANIVDSRKRKYRWLRINAIVEATWHDNSCKDADRDESRGGPDYEEREEISLAEAVRWADACQAPVTLFLYDEGDGIVERGAPPADADTPHGAARFRPRRLTPDAQR